MKHTCPCCLKDIEFSEASDDDFGNLHECSYCSAALKWSGKTLKIIRKGTVISKPPPEPTPALTPAPTPEPIPEPTPAPTPELKPMPEPVLEAKSEPEPEPTPAGALDSSSIEEPSSPPPAESSPSSESPLESKQEFAADQSPLEDQPEGEAAKPQAPLADPSPIQEDLQSFSDVEQYGNASPPLSKGPWFYDLLINGIDSIPIEKQILFILEDPRFKWDAQSILSTAQNGSVLIKKLNPVKAACLVQALMSLPVQLKWKQYMAVHAEPAEEPAEEAQTEETLKNPPEAQ